MTYIKLHVLKKEATDQFQENLKTIYKYKNQIDENERKRLFTEIKPNDPNHCEIISDFELDQSTTFSNRFELVILHMIVIMLTSAYGVLWH